jgi:hypothetical protein
MKRQITILLGLATLFACPALRAETDEEVEAHKTVLDLAGAFQNDGFKLRDGHWTGVIKPHEHALIAVNLYSGNQYWFSAATNGKAKKISLDVFDESGKPVTTETYNSCDRASAGFSPSNSGQFFVSIGVLEGDASTFCLVYSYK